MARSKEEIKEAQKAFEERSGKKEAPPRNEKTNITPELKKMLQYATKKFNGKTLREASKMSTEEINTAAQTGKTRRNQVHKLEKAIAELGITEEETQNCNAGEEWKQSPIVSQASEVLKALKSEFKKALKSEFKKACQEAGLKNPKKAKQLLEMIAETRRKPTAEEINTTQAITNQLNIEAP